MTSSVDPGYLAAHFSDDAQHVYEDAQSDGTVTSQEVADYKSVIDDARSTALENGDAHMADALTKMDRRAAAHLVDMNAGKTSAADDSTFLKNLDTAFTRLVSQMARDGQKETRKREGAGKGEGADGAEASEALSASGASDSGTSLRDLAEALGRAVSDRVASAKAKVDSLTADSDQGEILTATSEVGAAGFLATSAGGAMQTAIQGTNELARKGG